VNIGVTHITNGCYRLHLVEWNIGEAAGGLAAYCLARGLAPRQVRNTPSLLADFQRVLGDVLSSWRGPTLAPPRDDDSVRLASRLGRRIERPRRTEDRHEHDRPALADLIARDLPNHRRSR
jgi:hypothetical protein